MSWKEHGETGYDYARAEAGREIQEAITRELNRQSADLPDRYLHWIDLDALSATVMDKIDELSE